MKILKKIIIVCLLFNLVPISDLFPQENSKLINLTISGSGKTKEEARQNALRSAIEQAFGTFISSKTEILNDQLVSDQITSVSSGNIQSYIILNESQLPDGSWGNTIKAVVSLSKLNSFIESKGIEIEIKGGLFAINIKQQMLNEQAEINAISELVGLLHEPLQTAFDYSIKSSEPKSLDTENKNWEISLVVSALANKNMDFCANYCIKTLGALSLTNDEVKNYKILNKTVFPIVINYNGVNRRFYLRREESIHVLNSFIHNWKFYTRLFAVQSGMDKSNSNNSIEKIYDFKGKFSEVDFSLVFLTKGQLAATFSWQDERTLSQIEEMNGYTVRPTGIKSYIKFGGYVVYEKDGHGLVASIIDLKQMNRNLATIACDNLVFNGYSDWHLPSRDELSSIYENLHLLGIGGFRNKYYCSSIQEFSSIKWDQDFSNGVNEYNNEQEFYNIRPVRIF